MQACRSFFKSNPSIYVPRLYKEYSSKRVCTMEFIHGIKVTDVQQLQEHHIHPPDVARLIVKAFSDMIFQASFLHVDPHAGNLFARMVDSEGKTLPPTRKRGTLQLVLLDHGMYNYVDNSFLTFVQELWLGMVSQNTAYVEELCRPYGMEKYAQLLSLSLTGRSMHSNNK